ncbi:MAG: stage II sporulation protein R [Oscillospiraceae bacterium]|nr:stage II sporulation protein R [Oscillospiraceae bacterium]
MKLKIWELSLITALVVTMLFCCVTQGSQAELSEKLVRLHVVANSDSDEDQALKLKVRDAVLSEVEPIIMGASDREGAVSLLAENMDAVARAAGEAVLENGKNYRVKATIAQENFPTRRYDTFSLPAGSYTSLRVVIGGGEGRNWWCVAFPPLCKSAAVEDKSEEYGLTEGEVDLITGETGEYKLSFKTLEILQAIREWFKHKNIGAL